MASSRLIAPALLALLSLAGCNPQESAWEEAREADTISAYETFIQEYPESDYVEEAEQRVLALRRQTLWREAREADSLDAYQQFLAEFPDAEEAPEARERITELQREQQWQSLQGSEDISALRSFAEQHGGHPLAEQARERAEQLEAARQAEQTRLEEERRRAEEARNTHRVQLAAFQTEDRARQGVTVLEERLADTLDQTTLEAQPSGNLYLVQTQAMPEEAAASLCEQLKAGGQDCLVVER